MAELPSTEFIVSKILDEDLKDIESRLSLPGSLTLPNAKSSFRKDRRNYHQHFIVYGPEFNCCHFSPRNKQLQLFILTEVHDSCVLNKPYAIYKKFVHGAFSRPNIFRMHP